MFPTNLITGPFSLQEAIDAGLSPQDLRRQAWVRVASRLYRWRHQNEDALALLCAWHRMLPADATFAGPTACWLHGLELDPLRPVHVIVPSGSQRSRHGLAVRRCVLVDGDITSVNGMRVTTLHRTLRDICLRFEPREALVVLDMALAARKTDSDALRRYVHFARGLHGTRRMRWLAERAAPAESPMETRLRWLLLEAGLPTPEVQANLYDDDGHFLGRADLYYPSHRLIVEYDGANHRDRLTSDDRRQNNLLRAKFQLLRFTSPDIYGRPGAVVMQVREGLGGKRRVSGSGAAGFVGKGEIGGDVSYAGAAAPPLIELA